MKKLIKRVPSRDYVSSYDYSDALIEKLAEETREKYAGCPTLSPIELALLLGSGATLVIEGPFAGHPVIWSLEDDQPKEADTALVEALQMQAGIIPNRFKQDEAYLREGPGDMWEVRVSSSLDSSEWVDFEVRAMTADEACNKAEEVARRHADIYFGDPPPPRYTADRVNVYQMEPDDAE